MFHFMLKPSPPIQFGRDTIGQAVDSSARVKCAGEACMQHGIDMTQELDGIQVLATAVLVRQPVAFVARIVEVKHGRDCVDAQPVDMELLQPVDRIGQQKVGDLASTVVEDQGAPLAVFAPARVGMLIDRLAGEAGQREIILGEVTGDPVQDHTDAGCVAAVDQVAQIIRRRRIARLARK